MNEIYDLTDNAIRNWFDQAGEAFLRSLGVASGQRVLDFGCGYGGYTVPLTKVVGLTGGVIAVDKEDDRFEVVRDLLSGISNADRVDLHKTEGQLRFDWIADDSLDGVLLFDVLQHVDDWPTLFVEIRRILKSGGNLYVNPSAVSHPGKVDLDRLYEMADRHGLTVDRKVNGRIMHYKHLTEDDVHIFQLKA